VVDLSDLRRVQVHLRSETLAQILSQEDFEPRLLSYFAEAYGTGCTHVVLDFSSGTACPLEALRSSPVSWRNTLQIE